MAADTGPSSPISHKVRDRPLPPRPTSPPLPRRKNAAGLPPTYLNHLRALLHQWLEQQLQVHDDGLPSAHAGPAGEKKLWSAQRLAQIETELWAGTVIVQRQEGRNGLLDMDWNAWAIGAMRRRKAWKLEEEKRQAEIGEVKILDGDDAQKKSKKTSPSDVESSTTRGKLGIPSPLTATSSSTPSRSSSRPPSISSDHRSNRSQAKASPSGQDDNQSKVGHSEDLDDEEKRREWYKVISGLDGFQRLTLRKGDAWELVDDDFPVPDTHRDLPGAFPQSSHYDHRVPSPILTSASTGTTTQTESGMASPPDGQGLLKPFFSLHFIAEPTPTVNASSSTLHLKRQTSTSEEATGSVGSSSGRGWFSGTGSGLRWSDMTIGRTVEDEPIQVEFVEGRFALPSDKNSDGSKKSHFLNESKRQSSRHLDFLGGSAASSDAESNTSVSDVEDDLEADESSSTWSGTEKAGSHMPPDTSYTSIVGGAENDVPREHPVRVVGGTILIRGSKRKEEQQALENVIKALLYTIQSMYFELELLDAFRIPRELDPPILPPKPLQRSKTTQHHVGRNSGELQRRGSVKERGEKAKGFFQRLSKDTKGVWDGLLGRRSSISHERLSGPARTQTPPRNSFGSLGLPPEQPTLPPAPVESAGPSTPVVNHAADRSLQMLAQLDHLLPSTTPGLRIPMPPLLLRVQEVDRIRRQKAAEEVTDDIHDSQLGLGIEGLPRPSSNAGTPVGDGIKGRAMGYRLGGDVRAGLGVFSGTIGTFEGWIKLQRLEMLCCIAKDVTNGDTETVESNTMCSKPKHDTFIFYNDERDQTVHDFMSQAEDEDTCPNAGCEVGMEGHCRWFIHAGKRVEVRMRKLNHEEAELGCEDVWVACRECGNATSPRNLGEMASGHSWAKFLELLLYTDALMPPNICSHHSLTYHLRTSSRLVQISVTPVPMLDIRLPKLQVGPNVPKRKPGKVAALAAVEGITRREVRDKEIVGCKDEIGAFFVSIEERIAVLKRHLLPPEPSDKASDDIAPEKLAALQNLSASFRVLEAGLYDTLADTPPGQLNDVRREFCLAAKSVHGKLAEWQKANAITEDFDGVPAVLPDYVGEPKVWALPGSSVLIREEEPGSVIAYTLSSLPYFIELGNTVKSSATAPEDPQIPPKSAETPVDGEPWSVEVKRRDTPRDLLSLRTIAKKRSDASMVKPPSLAMSLTPNQPSLELSLEQVEGKSQASDRLGDLVRTISKATAQDPVFTAKARSPSLSESESSMTPRLKLSPKIRRRGTNDMDVPPSAFRAKRSVSSTPITPATSVDTANSNKDGWSSVTSSFSNSFNQLLKIGSDVGESLGSIRMRGTDRTLSSLIGPLSMMSNMDNSLSTFDDRPHIQFTYTLRDRLKIGCTVYYATAFDSLRRRCAIDKSLIASLARTEKWDANGGKSKASFFMTRDKRYIVKELVSKWNVSDTHAMLEIAPAYFEHLATTHNKATSLAKIVGFYSVKIHDIQANSKKTMDLLVMENIFYKQNVVQTYDLKGIEGRKVAKISQGCTLFDGEWLEGMSREPILLHPHAKRILTEALTLDTRFLSSQSIMDYSLLLGLDTSKSELVVGLVDAIGSYNLFKTIESRSKLALTRGGDVTIIPPDQYRERFENALRGYFIACPDKWSKTARRSIARTLDTSLAPIL
ncbi:hypothetical protein BCR39DRAFT_518613 [Naematelia encephala]|uniref:PIPK domain-containing protein n=1 Tax=Naematelia encephala TaxID=71784 RepID=A0A1Y2BFV1_9TREE|nr:hypothetical protein BCR39DRAFT_518613 [Naematelia encephala]